MYIYGSGEIRVDNIVVSGASDIKWINSFAMSYHEWMNEVCG